MHSDRPDLALFVAIPRPGTSDEYVEHLATYLASYLFPQEWAVFAWKRLGPNQKTSTFQNSGGRIHGFNGAQAIMLDYTWLKVNGRDVITGYMMSAGRDERAGQPPRAGADIGSPAGRSGLAHVIASITGEKYGDITDANR